MVINSIWPFILHMFLTLLFAIVISRFLRSNLLTVLISLAAALGISLLWRDINSIFTTYWQRLIETPIFGGAFFRDPSNDANLLGFLFNLVFPAILAYWVSVIAWRKRKESVE